MLLIGPSDRCIGALPARAAAGGRASQGQSPPRAAPGAAERSGAALTSRAAMVYLHGSNERQQAIADELSRQAAAQLGRSTAKPSGTQRARRRRNAS